MKQYLSGGKGDRLSIKNVNKEELKKGIRHEKEHTTNIHIATEIALDHLAEDPNYYSNLEKANISEMKKLNLKTIYLKEVNAKVVTMMKQRWKSENPNLDDQQMDYYIQRFEQVKNNPRVQQKDIMRYSWHDIEHLIDSFPVKPSKEFAKNSASTDGDLVYDKNNIQIFSGKTMRQCIIYADNEKYSWCISRTNVGSNLYTNYRFGNNPRSFYFVFDRDKTDKKSGGSFVDPIHAFVVHAQEDELYGFSNANNTGDTNNLKWNELGNKIKSFPGGNSTWEKIKNLESIFKYITPTEEESQIAMMAGKTLSDQQFMGLSYQLKTAYINLGKSLSQEVFKQLDNEHKNLYVNQGHIIPFEWVKDNKPLIKRFITLQIRDKHPINKNYLPFFTPEQKEWLFKNILFDKNTESQYINFDLINQYFPEQKENYIDFKLDNLDYISDDMLNSLSDRQRERYNHYNIIYINTKIEHGTESKYNTDTYYALSSLFEYKQYKQYPYKNEFEKLIIEKLDENSEFRSFLPITIISNNKLFFVLEEGDKYILIDSSGNILERDSSVNIKPDPEETVIKNIPFVIELGRNKITEKNILSLKEEINNFKKLAGLK